MQSPVEIIKERLSIVDIISEYIKIEKAGSAYKARCPFHNEKTPSFFISPNRSSFHCFGCGKSGDIFSFVQELEGISFTDALRVLADKAGISLDSYKFDQIKDNHYEIYKVLEDATQYFIENLKNNFKALDYLSARGLTPETIKSFRIGFAFDEFKSLVNEMTKRGHTLENLVLAGLASKTEKGVFDRFRGRIMFPIFDSAGKVVAFSGRIFDSVKEDVAKYINSPETELYHKSKILFGYDRAKRQMLKSGRAIIVEGQMDLILSHQSGIVDCVAVSGTALTEDHINLIKKFAQKIVFAFDGDEAGLKAMIRSIELSNKVGLISEIAPLKEGVDPADLILKDKDLWVNMLKNPLSFIDYMIFKMKNQKLNENDKAIYVKKTVFPYLKSLNSPLIQAMEMEKLATYLEVKSEIIKREISLISENEKTNFTQTPKTQTVIIQKKESEKAQQKVLGFLNLIKSKNFSPPKELIERLNEILKADVDIYLKEQTQKDIDRNLALMEIQYGDNVNNEVILEKLIDELENITLKEKFKENILLIKDFERAGDHEKTKELLLECNIITKRVEELKAKINF